MNAHSGGAPHDPAAECESCGGQVGTDPYLLATDGINGRVVTFHKRCDPNDRDLQRIHKITLAPVVLGVEVARLR